VDGGGIDLTGGAQVTSNVRVSGKKKLYKEPKLRVYGDIRELTRGTPSGMGTLDSIKSKHKT